MLKFSAFLFLYLIFACKQSAPDISDFKISDAKDIQKIEIQSKFYGLQILTKKSQRWYINNTIKVRPDAIENIFRIWPHLKVMNYPPKASWENIINSISNEGGLIRAYNVNGDLVKAIHLGGTTNDERGTYAIIEGARKPYVVSTPGFEGNLATRFFMDNNSWRDRMIIDLLPDEIVRIKMEYLDDINASFEIKRQDSEYKIFDIKNNPIQTDHSLVRSYLDAYKNVGSESIENDFINKNLVLNDKPHAILELIHTDQSYRKIIFYPNKLEGDPDIERMFVYDGKDFYLAQNRILMRLFRPISYFQGNENKN